MNKLWLDIQGLFRFWFPSLMGLIIVAQCFYLGQIFEIKFLSLCAIIAFAAMLTEGLEKIEDYGFIGFLGSLGTQRYQGPGVTIPAMSFMILTAATFGIHRDNLLYGLGIVLICNVLFGALIRRNEYKSYIFRVARHMYCSRKDTNYLYNYRTNLIIFGKDYRSEDTRYPIVLVVLLFLEPVFYSQYMFLYAHDFLYLHMVIVTIVALQIFKK